MSKKKKQAKQPVVNKVNKPKPTVVNKPKPKNKGR